MRKYLAAKIGLWLGAAFIMVAVFGLDLLVDIDDLRHEASLIEASNRQSHNLHTLEMDMYAYIKPVREFLITGGYQLAGQFSRRHDMLLSAIRDYQQQFHGEAAGLATAIDRVRPKAEAVFNLPFAVGNMEGPILLHEIEMEIKQAGKRLSESHHHLDAQVNNSMQILAGLRMDMRRDLIAVLAMLLLILSLLTWYVYRCIIHPLIQMRRAVQKAGAGDFNVRCRIESEDELGDLALAFNTMAQELKEREEMLNHARSMAAHQEKIHALGLMASGIAHEVGNPISAVSVSLDVALRKLSKGNMDLVRERLCIAREELGRTESIIRNILDYGAEEKIAKLSEIEIEPVLQSAITITRMSPRSKGVKLQVNLPEPAPCIRANEAMLRQVLVNLLLNGVDACAPKGHIRLSACLQNGGVALDIEDDGPGIPLELKDRIFLPLFTTKHQGSGSGLGLSISRELTERMKGRLELLRSGKAGSVFRIWLPIQGDIACTS